MKLISGGPNSGKTFKLIKMSAINNVPIVVTGYHQYEYIKQCAHNIGIIIPEPIVLATIEKAKGLGEAEVYVDNIDQLVAKIFSPLTTVSYATMTIYEEEVK